MRQFSMRTIIGSRFALVILASILFISMAANLLINRQFESYMEEKQDKQAISLAENIQAQYDSESDSFNIDYVHGLGMYALNEGYFINLYDANGNSLWDARNHDMAGCQAMMNTITMRMEQNGDAPEGDFVTKRFELTNGTRLVGYLDVDYYSPYYMDEDEFQFTDALNRILFVTGLISLLGAVTAGIFLAGNITKSVDEVSQVAGQIANGNFKTTFRKKKLSKELLQLEQSITQMQASLEKQEVLRKQLTTDVAHELRTPISNISAYLEAMLEGAIAPDEESLRRCFQELNRLSSLISDMEKLRQIESNTIVPEKENTDIYGLLEDTILTFAAQLEEKKLTCTLSGPHVHGPVDTARMKQVFINLLSNACKYTNEGGKIEIQVTETPNGIRIIVADNGIGISETDLPNIFERFYRADKSRSRGTGGAGVGLTIAKAIVDAHGGEIRVESQIGKGTTFIIDLPGENPR